jgi:hypothetical protein
MSGKNQRPVCFILGNHSLGVAGWGGGLGVAGLGNARTGLQEVGKRKGVALARSRVGPHH